MRKRILRKLGLALFGLLFALVVGELAARILLAVLPDPPDSVFVKDAHTTWRFRPSPPDVDGEDPEHVNALGFRDREHAVPKPAGTYRILGVGDSFVFGAVPPARNFLRVAEERLNPPGREPGARAEVLLMGCPGFSPEHYRGLIAGLGPERRPEKDPDLEPDLIVVCFFAGNDVTGIPVRGRVIRGQKYYTGSPRPWLHLLRRSRLFLLAESLFVREIKLAWLQRKRARQGMPDAVGTSAPAAAPAGEAPGPRVSPLYLEIEAKNLPVYLREPGSRLRGLWREAEGYLDDIDRICRGAGVPWLLLIIPEEVQVDPRVRAQVFAGLGLDPARYDLDLPQRRLTAWAADRGVPVVDPLPELRAAHRPGARLYVPNDTHWNERGNRLAGELLGAAIATRRAAAATGTAPGR